jgi:hypothetical protein
MRCVPRRSATLARTLANLEGEAMTDRYGYAETPRQPTVNAGRLWAGGLATALVAAMIALVGILIGRGLLDVDILAPKGAGVWGEARTVWYVVGAAAASLVATAIAHVLVLYAPRPTLFFGWVVALATVVAVVAPFATEKDLGSRVYTALLNLILGVAIGSLVTGSARTAVRPDAPAQPEPYTYDPEQM